MDELGAQAEARGLTPATLEPLLREEQPNLKASASCLADPLYREVLSARAMRPEDKLLAGPRLLDLACRVMMDGIRHQYPDADERRVQEILRERLALARRIEELP